MIFENKTAVMNQKSMLISSRNKSYITIDPKDIMMDHIDLSDLECIFIVCKKYNLTIKIGFKLAARVPIGIYCDTVIIINGLSDDSYFNEVRHTMMKIISIDNNHITDAKHLIGMEQMITNKIDNNNKVIYLKKRVYNADSYSIKYNNQKLFTSNK